MTLTGLPDDILVLLLRLLEPPALLRLGQLSKRLHHFTQQALKTFLARTTHQLFLHRYLPFPEKHHSLESMQKLSALITYYANTPDIPIHPAHQLELKLLFRIHQNPEKLQFWLRSQNATWFSFIPRFLTHDKKNTLIAPEEEIIIKQQLLDALPYLKFPEQLEQLEPLSKVLTPAQFYPVTQSILKAFCKETPTLPAPISYFEQRSTNLEMLEALEQNFSQLLLKKGATCCDNLESPVRDISYKKMKKLLKDPNLTLKAFIEGIYAHTTLLSRLQNAQDLFKKTLTHPQKELITYLLTSGMNILTPTENFPPSTFAHIAATNRSPSVLERLFSNISPNVRDGAWDTPLHKAAEAKNIRVVVYLVDHGAKLDAKNRAGNTFWNATSPRTQEQIFALMERQIALHFSTVQDSNSRTPSPYEGQLNPTPTPL